MSTVEVVMCSLMCPGSLCACNLLLLLGVSLCKRMNSAVLQKGLFLMLYPSNGSVYHLLMDFR